MLPSATAAAVSPANPVSNTPAALDMLTVEQQEEYRRLKEKLVAVEQQQGMANSKKSSGHSVNRKRQRESLTKLASAKRRKLQSVR